MEKKYPESLFGTKRDISEIEVDFAVWLYYEVIKQEDEKYFEHGYICMDYSWW